MLLILYFSCSDFYVMKVLKESFKIYCAINDGIINLVDMVGICSNLPLVFYYYTSAVLFICYNIYV